ncbi:MAG: hypothetical protein KatS3mg035_0563 [Bacteroidia bacterium]|nr:MAG: hypothetical protein KatS3mg035_0563 [Bacteroidia bacterium]
MNQKSFIGIVGTLLLVSFFLNFYSLMKIQGIEQKLQIYQKSEKNNEEAEEFELAEKMMFLQRYSEKLFFSGMQKKWDLAAFLYRRDGRNCRKSYQG